MNIETYKLTTALLIIKKGETSASSYGLCRLLSRAFDIIDCKDIIDELVKFKYIITIKDEFSQFAITESGIQFLNDNKHESINKLESSGFCNSEFGKFMISTF